MRRFARGSKVRLYSVSYDLVIILYMYSSFYNTLVYAPFVIHPTLHTKTTEKLEKEKQRHVELEKTSDNQQVVIEKLSEEYQDAMDELDEVRQSVNYQAKQDWEEEKATLLHKNATRIEHLQNEIDDLLNSQAGQEEEYNKAMDDLDQLNTENTEYLERIQEYESTLETLQEQEDEYEASRVKFSVMTIEHKELKSEMTKREEQNDGLMRQMEALNSENNDLQEQIYTLEKNINAIEEERTKLQDSVTQNSDLCSQMEAKLSTSQSEKDTAVKEYESKVDDLKAAIAQKEAELETIMCDNTAEKEKISKDMADMGSRHQEAVTGLQTHISGSTVQISKLIDQLSTASSEKAMLMSKFDSVSSDLAIMKDKTESQASTITQLESSIETLTVERDTATSRVTELMSGNQSIEQVLSDLQSEKKELVSKAEEQEEKIVVLEAEKEKTESTINELQEKATSLTSDLDTSTAAISALKDQVEAVNEQKSSLVVDANEKKLHLQSRIELANALQVKSIEEKNALVLAMEKHEKTIANLESQIEVVNEKQAKVIDEKNALELAADEQKKTIERLEGEKNEATAKLEAKEAEAHALKSSTNVDSNDQQTKIITLQAEIDELKYELKHALEAEKAEAFKLKSSLDANNTDHDAKIKTLQAEIDKLRNANAQLMEENELMEESAAVQSLPQSAGIDDEMRELQDDNILLKEAVQDIQVEKEDLELENEELASKLTDLTTQAKKMLLNNESLDEALQDQQIEYEDRIAELEGLLEEKTIEGAEDSDSDAVGLQEKHKVALETIVRLKKDIFDGREATSKAQEDVGKLKHLEVENLELRQVIDHCSAENEAAKELKFFVTELKAKQMEISESLHVSQEQNDAAADIIENLKADNDRLRKDIAAMISSPKPDECDLSEADGSAKMREMEVELQSLRAKVSRMNSDNNLFNSRLSQIMDISYVEDNDAKPPMDAPEDVENGGALVVAESSDNKSKSQWNFDVTDNSINNGAMVVSDGHQLSLGSDKVEEQIQHLTIENGQLAQRLGNAVADKECESNIDFFYALVCLS